MTEEIAAKIFAEWIRRYNEDPESMSTDYNADDYPEVCADFFMKLWKEIK